ncbi:MAG: hypothetical protein VB110_09425 [Bacteroidales bacterium]|nr:hypothetical protein [Bacteroidales bacterium]
MLTKINYTLVKTEDDVHYIEYNGNYFKINYNAYHLLSMVKQGLDIHEIAQNLNMEIAETNNAIMQIKEALTKKVRPPKIKRLFTILNNHCCNGIGESFGFLFDKTILYGLTILSLITTLLFYLLIADDSLLSFHIGFAGYLAALMIIMFFHEVGHVCAGSHYQLKNLKISAGVYYIWPVFYVSLNQQVLLPREKRIIVSAGGLYFQLLLNLLCIMLNAFFQNDFILLVIHLNLALFLVNIAPMVILDGYWIYADLFRIENLDTKAKALLKTPVSKIKFLKNIPAALSVYAAIRLLAILSIWFMASYFLISNAGYFPDIIYSLQDDLGMGIIFRAVFLAMPYLLFLIYLYKTIYGRLSKND